MAYYNDTHDETEDSESYPYRKILLVSTDRDGASGNDPYEPPLEKTSEKVSATGLSSRVRYDVSVAELYHYRNIQIHPLATVRTDPIVTKKAMTLEVLDSGETGLKADAHDSFLPVGFRQTEMIAEEALADISDQELSEMQKAAPVGLSSYNELPYGLKYKPERKRENEDTASMEESIALESRENMFSHAKTFLEAFVKDEGLRNTIAGLSYDAFRNEGKVDPLPLTLHQAVTAHYGALTQPENYDHVAEERMGRLIQDMLNSALLAQGKTADELVDTLEGLKEYCHAKALAPRSIGYSQGIELPHMLSAKADEEIASKHTEHSLSFDDALQKIAREVASDEREREQTYTKTTDTWMRQAYVLGGQVLYNELLLRAVKTRTFGTLMPDGSVDYNIPLYPAFNERARHRQASYLAERFDAEELMNSLMPTMSSIMRSCYQLEDKQREHDRLAERPFQEALLEDASRLLDAYLQAIELRREKDGDPLSVLDRAETAFRNARQRVERLLLVGTMANLENSFALSEEPVSEPISETENAEGVSSLIHLQESIFASPQRLKRYILDGASPKLFFDYDETADGRTRPEVIVQHFKGMENSPALAADLTQRSAEMVCLKKLSVEPQIYTDLEDTTALLALELGVGIAGRNTSTGALTYTDRHFLLPAGQDTNHPLFTVMKDAEKFDPPRIAKIFAYNLSELMQQYKAQKTTLKNPVLTEQSNIANETCAMRLEFLDGYLKKLADQRPDIHREDIWKNAVKLAAEGIGRDVELKELGVEEVQRTEKLILSRLSAERSSFLQQAFAMSSPLRDVTLPRSMGLAA